MNHIGLFEGFGGFSLAARWAGWQTVATCEIAKHPRRVISHHFPKAYHHEDIHDFNYGTVNDSISERFGEHWRDEKLIITGGFPCFKAGTMILTKEGLKCIENVSLEDYVLTKEGRYMKINALMRKDNAPTLGIKFQGDFESLTTTFEHPFWAKRRIKAKARKYKNRFDEAKWIEAGNLKAGDLIGQRVLIGDIEYKDENFWYLVGRFLGDGWILDGKRKSNIPQGKRGSRINSFNHKVVICCNKSERLVLKNIIENAGYSATISEERTVCKFIISNKELAEFMMQFGRYAHGKKLPGMCFMLKENLKIKLFEGWLSADGYSKGDFLKVTTVSHELARGMAKIATDVYKVPVSVSKKTTNRTLVIEGRRVNERPQYCVSVNKSSRSGFYEDGFVWTIVKKVDNLENITVFNIGVDEDESYTANGVTVHNCQPYSTAGKRLGKDDDRHLWPQMLRVIQEFAPDWVVGENVSGIISWNGGLVFEEVQVDLESEGYEVWTVVLPAASVGAPHRRDRVWFIANRSNTGIESVQFGGENGVLGSANAANTASDRREWKRSESSIENRNPESGLSRIMERGSEGLCSLRNATNPDGDIGHERGMHQKGSEEAKRHFSTLDTRDGRGTWQNFPTQSPICGGNDGFPAGMVLNAVSYPKWRNESIKGYGNAIVPQVAYEIFKVINKIEK